MKLSADPLSELTDGCGTVYRWWISRPVNQDVIQFYLVKYVFLDNEVVQQAAFNGQTWREYMPYEEIQPALVTDGRAMVVLSAPSVNWDAFMEAIQATFNEWMRVVGEGEKDD